jgi:hypothetical protein
MTNTATAKWKDESNPQHLGYGAPSNAMLPSQAFRSREIHRKISDLPARLADQTEGLAFLHGKADIAEHTLVDGTVTEIDRNVADIDGGVMPKPA